MKAAAAEPWGRVGAFAAASAAAEVGLGSALHAWHVPLSGHVMANLQGAVLAAFLDRRRERRPQVFFVSAISAALKSLSPAGKRLRPMIAIVVQGALYHFAVALLGAGAWGAAAGQALIGAWCSLQPFAFQLLFFGSDILKSYEALFDGASRLLPVPLASPLAVLGWWTALHAALSAVIGVWAWAKAPKLVRRVESWAGTPAAVAAEDWPPLPPWRESARQALRELRRPFFLWPFAFVLAFGWLGRERLDHLALVCLRATGIGFLAMLLVKRADFPALARWLERRGWPGPAAALQAALGRLSHRA